MESLALLGWLEVLSTLARFGVDCRTKGEDPERRILRRVFGSDHGLELGKRLRVHLDGVEKVRTFQRRTT